MVVFAGLLLIKSMIKELKQRENIERAYTEVWEKKKLGINSDNIYIELY